MQRMTDLIRADAAITKTMVSGVQLHASALRLCRLHFNQRPCFKLLPLRIDDNPCSFSSEHHYNASRAPFALWHVRFETWSIGDGARPSARRRLLLLAPAQRERLKTDFLRKVTKCVDRGTP